ncbi:MAG: hypothetical protein HQK73_04020 [Desulfamplus sp.]|nr:hypothetical protein [Desulfamplus sp.]
MYKDNAEANKKRTRKRKSRKDHANDGVYAAISPASYKIGQIVNINTGNTHTGGITRSGGSLVFKYIDKDDHHTSSTQEKSIFLENYGYYFGDIPLNGELPFLSQSPVIIEEVDFANLSSEYLMKIREMSMVFTELNFRQIFALDKFIRENMNQKRFNSVHLTVESQ